MDYLSFSNSNEIKFLSCPVLILMILHHSASLLWYVNFIKVNLTKSAKIYNISNMMFCNLLRYVQHIIYANSRRYHQIVSFTKNTLETWYNLMKNIMSIISYIVYYNILRQQMYFVCDFYNGFFWVKRNIFNILWQIYKYIKFFWYIFYSRTRIIRNM